MDPFIFVASFLLGVLIGLFPAYVVQKLGQSTASSFQPTETRGKIRSKDVAFGEPSSPKDAFDSSESIGDFIKKNK